MENKRVGIFTKMYRNEPTMHKAIQSVLEQTYTNFKHYILVSAATKQEVMEYAEKDARIIVLDGKPGEGLWDYIKYIAGENAYVTVIDADDWYERTYLEELCNCLEEEELDIVACGNYFVDIYGNILETRKQRKMVWNIEDTFSVLPYMYAFYRTIWGKLIKSELWLKWVSKLLPENDTYGGYGRDTMIMFSLLPFAKKAAIYDKALYNYRMSSASSSYILKEGRLDSDKTVFLFVKSVLEKLGTIGEREERVLYIVYGEALKDTTRLLLNQKLREEERAEKLLYVYQCELTVKLLAREREGMLTIQGMKPREEKFVETFYNMIFSDIKKCSLTFKTATLYLELFYILYPELKGVLSAEEFIIIIKKKNILDAFAMRQYQVLFEELLDLLPEIKLSEAKTCLKLLRRLTTESLLLPLLQEKKFILTYMHLIKMLNRGEKEKALQWLQECFSCDTIPYDAEILAELWINIAATLEWTQEFVFGKQLKTEILYKNGKKEEAREEYNDLKELGIEDTNMAYLKTYFEE